MKIRLLLVLVLFAGLQLCHADTLILLDGTKYEGQVFVDGDQTTIITTKGEMKSFPSIRIKNIIKSSKSGSAIATPKPDSNSTTITESSGKNDDNLSKYQKARKLYLKGDYEAAINAYKVIKPKANKNPIDVKFFSTSCARLAFLENDAGNSKKAFEYALLGVIADEDVVEDCRKIALAKASELSREYADKNNFRSAWKILKEVYPYSKGDISIAYHLAYFYQEDKKYKETYEILKKEMKLSGKYKDQNDTQKKLYDFFTSRVKGKTKGWGFSTKNLVGYDKNKTTNKTWQQMKTKHFVIHYRNKELAEHLLLIVEDYYDECTNALVGEDIIAKEKSRIDYYLYPTQAEFDKNHPEQKGFAGCATVENEDGKKVGKVYSYQQAGSLFSKTTPHEIAHVIFKLVLGQEQTHLSFIHEGLAQSFEPKYKLSLKTKQRKEYVENNQIYNMNEFMKSENILKKYEASVFYFQADVVGEILLAKKGYPGFIQFAKKIQSSDVNTALRFCYGLDMNKLQKEFDAYIKKNYK